MVKILPLKFFRRPAPIVAKELLGKFLVRKADNIALMITEVEAYEGFEDLASHASRGLTDRNKVMFLTGGVWYIYLVYGMHFMLNIVTNQKDHPSAILIRSVEGVKGPGRVGKLFKVKKSDYGQTASMTSGLYIEDRGIKIKNDDIQLSPRIGVNYAGPVWSKKKFNFKLKSKCS